MQVFLFNYERLKYVEKYSIYFHVYSTYSFVVHMILKNLLYDPVADLIFFGFRITADGDCSHEMKRPLLLVRKAMTNLGSILKGRGITLLTKVHLVKLWFFGNHVWM